MSVTYVDDSNAELPQEPPIMNINNFDSLHVTETDVNDQLKNLDVDKSYGPDGISPKLLKEAGATIAKFLQHLFNKSLSSGTFPMTWKQANVTPFFEKGCKSSTNNYRPVSLLSAVDIRKDSL